MLELDGDKSAEPDLSSAVRPGPHAVVDGGPTCASNALCMLSHTVISYQLRNSTERPVSEGGSSLSTEERRFGNAELLREQECPVEW